MDDTSETTYWCHMCSQSVNPVIQGEIIMCNLCQSGFVEEMDNVPDPVTTDHDDHQSMDSLWFTILIGMMYNQENNTRNQRTSESIVQDEDANGGESDLNLQLEEIIRSRGRHSSAIFDLLQGIQARLSIESETTEDNPDNELMIMINSFNQRLRTQDSIDTNSVPSGYLSDNFIGHEFEMLLQRLSENDPNNRYGTPPATKEAVEALEMVKIEKRLHCTVCLDDFEIGMEVKEMPCKHKFHSGCLLPWLELHSSCPVCRYLLPTTDVEPKTDAET